MKNNPLATMQGFAQQFSGFMKNPVQMMMQNKVNIPQNMQNDPNQIIQHMMNTGMISQEQYNKANQIAQQMQNNLQLMQMLGGK